MGALTVLQLGVSARAAAQDTTRTFDDALRPDSSAAAGGPYFYRGLPYGSDALTGPFDVLLNKGFALSIAESGNRKIFATRYGVTGVADALAHPLQAIERGGGWWRFVRTEMLPLSYQSADIKWYTNYTGHLIEGGIHWRRMTEWYEAHGVPLPGIAAAVTTLSAALVNEVYESGGSELGSAATVADLYFFDLAGIALFSFEGVSRFFARTLHAGLWTGQASLVLPAAEIGNNANHLYVKIPWGVVPRSSVFFWTGIGGGLGLTAHRPGGLDVSLALGTDAERMVVNPVTGEESAELTWAGGLFIDRNGSLLGSVHLSDISHRLLRVNVYPGVLGGVARNLGLWAVLSRNLDLRVGLSHRSLLGAGVGFGR